MGISQVFSRDTESQTPPQTSKFIVCISAGSTVGVCDCERLSSTAIGGFRAGETDTWLLQAGEFGVFK